MFKVNKARKATTLYNSFLLCLYNWFNFILSHIIVGSTVVITEMNFEILIELSVFGALRAQNLVYPIVYLYALLNLLNYKLPKRIK